MKPQNQGEKIIQSRKKIRSKPKTACKTVKADKFSHPSYQNPNRSDIEVTSGAKRRFRGYALRCVEAKIAAQKEEELRNPKRKN